MGQPKRERYEQQEISNNTSSSYKGVHWHKQLQKWTPHINIYGKQIRLGCFHDEKAAARAYNEKALELFGEYACLNDISDDEDDDASVISDQ